MFSNVQSDVEGRPIWVVLTGNYDMQSSVGKVAALLEMLPHIQLRYHEPLVGDSWLYFQG